MHIVFVRPLLGAEKTIGMWNTSGLWQALTRQKEIKSGWVVQELPQDGPAFKVARGHRAICGLDSWDMLADRKSIMTDFVSPCFRQWGDTRGVPFADADCQGETFSTCQDLKLIRSLRLWIPADHFEQFGGEISSFRILRHQKLRPNLYKCRGRGPHEPAQTVIDHTDTTYGVPAWGEKHSPEQSWCQFPCSLTQNWGRAGLKGWKHHGVLNCTG